MFIDIAYFILLLFALYKGFNRGFIVAIFSYAGMLIGLAAAIKLSAVVAIWLKTGTHINAAWLPFLSFILVMVGVIALVRLAAGLLQKTVELMLMGWLNKAGGILLYFSLYTTIFSVVLFYAVQLNVFTDSILHASKCYAFVQPWAPVAINGIAKVFPVFRDMFTALEGYFEAASKKI
ncbi:CvpA family protein [Parasediminibacterium sp. JCM 36343]|uniref:CvpA family protein n=1 Tax=Parasediminibacterium sp. JCM 36343 TaxID=3374279 RepID=UPI00397941F7